MSKMYIFDGPDVSVGVASRYLVGLYVYHVDDELIIKEISIMKTIPCNVYLITPRFYIVKLESS